MLSNPPVLYCFQSGNVHLKDERGNFCRRRSLAHRLAEHLDLTILIACPFRKVFDLIDEVSD